MTQFAVGIDLKSEFRNPFQVFRLKGFRRLNPVAVKVERTPGRDGRIQLAQRSGRGVSRVRKSSFTPLFALVVQLAKRLQAEENFSANLRGHIFIQAEGNRMNGAHISGDDFSSAAVSSSNGFVEQSVFIDERNAQAVDLELGDVIDGVGFRQLRHTARPVCKFLFGIRILEAEHRPRKRVRRKFFRRFTADALSRGIRRDQLRVLRFKLLELPHQLIEIEVGYGGLIQDVVAVFVLAKLLPQLLDAIDGRFIHHEDYFFRDSSRIERNSVPGFHSGHLSPLATRTAISRRAPASFTSLLMSQPASYSSEGLW